MTHLISRGIILAPWAGAALLVGLLAFPIGDASAWVRSRPRGGNRPLLWPKATITMTLDTRDLPLGLTRGQVLEVLQRAATHWSRPTVDCTAVRIEVRDGSHTRAGGGTDSRNSIAFHRRHWCRSGVKRAGTCHDPRTASLTTLRLGQERDGAVHIEEADIEFNAAGFSFSTEGEPAASATMDLETVVLHELGHVLGFDHVCGRRQGPKRQDHRGRQLPDCGHAGKDPRPSVMVPAGDLALGVPVPVRRRLSPDDVQAVCTVYPTTEGITGTERKRLPEAR